MARKMIVGVVGGSRRPAAIAQTEWEEYLQLAIEIGEMVADCNCAILTGATLWQWYRESQWERGKSCGYQGWFCNWHSTEGGTATSTRGIGSV